MGSSWGKSDACPGGDVVNWSSLPPEELVASYLADAEREPQMDLPWQRCQADRVVGVLQENKVALVSVQAADANDTVVSSEAFARARAAEAQIWSARREEYRNLKERLEVAGVPDVMIKSVGRAPSFPYRGGNVDLLYRPQHVDQVRSTLRDLGYVELRNVEEAHKYLFHKFHAGECISAIHVHAHVGWVVSFLDEERCFGRAVPSADDPLVTVSGATDGLLTTLAHFLYEDKRLNLQDLARCAHCLRQGIDWGEADRVAAMRGWGDGLHVALLLYAYQERFLYGECLVPRHVLERAMQGVAPIARFWLRRILGRSWEDYVFGSGDGRPSAEGVALAVPFGFSKYLFYLKLLRDPSRSRGRRAKDIALHSATGTKLRLHIHSQPRMLVTFSGIDGCGKTTQATSLRKAFDNCLIRADYVWTRGGSSSWVGRLIRLAKSMLGRKSPTAGSANPERLRERQALFRSRWARWVWSWLVGLEVAARYFRRVTWPLIRGRVVLCDRYVIDSVADWVANFRDPATADSLVVRLMRAVSPSPDMGFWLAVAPSRAQARTVDLLPEDYVDAQHVAYERMAGNYGLSVLDASRPWQDVSDEVVLQVLTAYFADYHTAINALFLKNPGQWR